MPIPAWRDTDWLLALCGGERLQALAVHSASTISRCRKSLGGDVISSFYAAILGLLIVWLSLRVIKLRRAHRVRLGDGGVPELQIAIRAQGNATEYVPLSLILLALLEFSEAPVTLVHVGGIAVLAGRLLHARGLLTNRLRYRILGMQFTIFTLIGLALANLSYAVHAGFRALS